MKRTIYTYFHHEGISAHRFDGTDHSCAVAWSTRPHPIHNPQLTAVFEERQIAVDPRDQRILVAFDGITIPGGMPKNAKLLSTWQWPEFFLCVKHHHVYEHNDPPSPAWKAGSGHVIAPMQRYLYLVAGGKFAFFRWDAKTVRRIVTFCTVYVTAPNTADVTWNNTSP